jgi:chorismate mutase
MLTIEQLRKKIEQTDATIIEKLAKRQKLSKQIGQLKLRRGKDIVDRPREEQLFEFYEKLSERYHLQRTFVKRLFKLIIAYSRMVQKS